ncbi:cytochrome b/b6 domain-containing protein [Rathayibacter sp. CAU 1779]
MSTQEQTAARPASRWRPLTWIVPVVVVGAAFVVLLARWFVAVPAVADFIRTYPGTSALPAWAPVGFPLWLAILHFLSGAFLFFIVVSGWSLRRTRRGGGRPREFWIRDNDRLVRTKNPPVRITLTSWWHLTVDALWVLTGVLFVVLLFSTGQWVRIVPTRWDVIPNAVSAALQYASLDWPVTNGWVDYNALQLLTYFATVFLAAPLAVLTGIRLAPGLSVRLRRLDKAFPLPVVRVVHYSVMIWFVAFTVVHVALVLLTGPLRNLNHMYGLRDDSSWVGLIVWAASLIVIAVAAALLRPPRLDAVAELTGSVKRR